MLPMKSIKKIFIAGLLAAFSASIVFAQSHSITVDLPTSKGKGSFVFKLLIPTVASNGSIQSVVLFATPIGKEKAVADFLTEEESKQFSQTHKCAFVEVTTVSGGDTLFAQLSTAPSLKDSINAGLSRLAIKSGHPELNNAAIIPVGLAAASRFTISVASALPERTAGLATLLAYNLSSSRRNSIAKIPHLVTTGENSGPDVRNNESVFFSELIRKAALARRASGELIHHSIEMNASQSTLKRKGMDLLFAFIAKSIEYRIPLGFNAMVGIPTLLPIIEANGYLGQNKNWEGFGADQIQTSNFSGLTANSSFWLFDAAYAKTWSTFQISSFDSYQISPIPTVIEPYCTGQRPSALSAYIKVNSSVQLQGNNYFRVEVSDITGNFDNPTYPTRYTGTKLSALNVDTLNQIVIFPDNLAYSNPVPPNTVKRYKMRIVASNPYFESVATSEISLVNNCGPAGGEANLYLSTIRPYKKFYNRGDVLTFSVFKKDGFSAPAGTSLRIDLSGKIYSFDPGIPTTMLTATPNFSTAAGLDSAVYSITLPDTLSFGPRYRLKPYLTSSGGTRTAGNGHDITVIPNTTSNTISISTTTVNTITQTTAKSGATIFSDGGSAISVRGICWNTSPLPTVFLSTKTIDGNGTGEYISNLTNLSPGTLYYVRAYATNAQGTTYGEERTFTTVAAPQAPVLITQAIYEILETSAKGGGRITKGGGSEITAKGLCWATTPAPTVDNFSVSAGVDTSAFSNTTLTGLFSNTTYYVRAYATNSTGTGYGNELTFITLSAPPILAQITIQNIIPAGITATAAVGGGTIASDGGSQVTDRGLVWDVASGPTIALPTKASSGSGPGVFNNVLISPLMANTTYFVRAFATNAVGTSYSDEISFTTTVSVLKTKGGNINLVIHPNPALDNVFLSSDLPINRASLRLYGTDGKQIVPELEQVSNHSYRISTSGLGSGVYYLKVSLNGGTTTLKIVK